MLHWQAYIVNALVGRSPRAAAHPRYVPYYIPISSLCCWGYQQVVASCACVCISVCGAAAVSLLSVAARPSIFAREAEVQQQHQAHIYRKGECAARGCSMG